ncbi:MAG TPA: transcriptional repressor [Nitrospiria bacterium]|nr:transcriptional repressor [Nitrospiria bacterium]
MEKEVQLLRDHLSKNHLKLTHQRELILAAFLKADHITAEDLYREITRKKKDHNLGLATIYRTLNLFCEIGIAQQRRFGDSRTFYDNVSGKNHHDHLICTRCGGITEFESPPIERLQEEVARKKGFQITSHRLELYGICSACKEQDV